MQSTTQATARRTSGGPKREWSTSRWRSLSTRSFSTVAVLLTAMGVMLATSAVPAGASSPADQGVTATTISIGEPYVDFAALHSLGVTINDGSFPDAYQAGRRQHQRARGSRRSQARSSTSLR